MKELNDVLGTILVFVVLVVSTVGIEAWAAYREVSETKKEEFFTCDKHGVFTMKAAIEAPLPYGGVQKVCPFCFDQAFKKADEMLQAEERRRAT